jgi:Flp pilus assembly protein TadD
MANTDSLLASAVERHRQQDLTAAAALYEQIIRRDPRHFFAHHALGAIHAAAGRIDAALPLLSRAVQLAPDHAEAQANLGAALIEAQRLDEAEAPIRRALALDPEAAEPLNHWAKLQGRRDQWDEAVPAYRRVLALAPDDPIAAFNLGNALFQAGKVAEAVAALRQAVRLAPHSARARTGLGLALAESGDRAAGLMQIRRAIALDPGDPAAYQAEYGLLLAAGEWREGFEKYENRSRGPGRFFFHHGLAEPPWQGQDLAGKRLLLHAEQGLGDTLMLVRYLPMVRAKGPAQIILSVQPALAELLAAGSDADLVLPFGAVLPEFDLHCPLMSLPLIFGTRVETVPPAPGYLRRHLTPRPEIGTMIADLPRPRIGLAWSANLQAATGRRRSVPLALLASILALPASFLVLHTELSAAERAALAGTERVAVLDRGFADTAAAIDALDLVVTIDTSIAHLAGGLGRPCWILLPQRADWRWLERGDDTPWYPMARLFRQHDGAGWAPVIERVLEALRRDLSGGR